MCFVLILPGSFLFLDFAINTFTICSEYVTVIQVFISKTRINIMQYNKPSFIAFTEVDTLTVELKVDNLS